MLVICMTSWTKRIGNVKKVVESIMSNTVLPDKVFLNLSKEEFKDIELPQDLLDYFNSDERLIINWVEGPNTKSFKKIFNILDYLDEDDIIINVDDDILLPKDLIEHRLKDFKKYGCKFPLSSSNRYTREIPNAMVMAPVSLYQKKMFNNWEKYVNDIVISTNNDDRTYLYIIYLNGYLARPVSRYTARGLKKNFSYNQICSMSSMHLYPIGGNYDKIVAPIIFKLTGTTISNAFGYFSKNINKN